MLDPVRATKLLKHNERAQGVKFAKEQMKLGRMVVDFGFSDLHHYLIAYEDKPTIEEVKDGASWVPDLMNPEYINIMKHPEDLP